MTGGADHDAVAEAIVRERIFCTHHVNAVIDVMGEFYGVKPDETRRLQIIELAMKRAQDTMLADAQRAES